MAIRRQPKGSQINTGALWKNIVSLAIIGVFVFAIPRLVSYLAGKPTRDNADQLILTWLGVLGKVWHRFAAIDWGQTTAQRDTLVLALAALTAAATYGRRAVRMLRLRFDRVPPPKSVGLSENLSRAFLIDRRDLIRTFVPEHLPSSRIRHPGKPFDFGDARYILSSTQQAFIEQFLRIRRKPLSNNPFNTLAARVILVTGEPGAGKSVLLQELQNALSEGVEHRVHGIVPLVLFAREFTWGELESLGDMRALLLRSYEKRLNRSLASRKLDALYDLIVTGWHQTDFIVLVDGMDEVPQRSEYERIHRRVMEFIKADVLTAKSSVHKYILTCRTDENLDLFSDVSIVAIQGLSDRQRVALWKALLPPDAYSDRWKTLQALINSPRVSPSHVFKRNPYFFALLATFIADPRTVRRVEAGIIDFDFLMREYLKREATRPHARVHDEASIEPAELERGYGELAQTARITCMFVGARSFLTGTSGSLFDEFQLTSDLVESFASSFFTTPGLALDRSTWQELAGLFSSLESTYNLDTEQELTNTLTRRVKCIHENDVRLLCSYRRPSRRTLELQQLAYAIETVRSFGWVESREWYDIFCAAMLNILQSSAELSRCSFPAILFVRSLAAAHSLKIILIRIEGDRIYLRFRHRRLAEYYSACYLIDRWSDLTLDPPSVSWIGSVMNLTCAIEGPRNTALEWLVSRVAGRGPMASFEWRRRVELASEAFLFAEPGHEFPALLSRFVATLMIALTRDLEFSSARGQQAAGLTIDSTDPITTMTILRTLALLGQLRSLLPGPIVSEHRTVTVFAGWVAGTGREWFAPAMEALKGINMLHDRHPPLVERTSFFLRSIVDPLSVISAAPSHASVPQLRLAAGASIIAAEITSIVVFTALWVAAGTVPLVFFGVPELYKTALSYIGIAMLLGVLFYRGALWLRSPYLAIDSSTIVWRIPAGLQSLFSFDRVDGTLFLSGRRPTWKRFTWATLKLTAMLPVGLLMLGIIMGLPAGIYFASDQDAGQVSLFDNGDLRTYEYHCQMRDNAIKEFQSSLTVLSAAGPAVVANTIRAGLDNVRKVANTEDCDIETPGGRVNADIDLVERIAGWAPEAVAALRTINDGPPKNLDYALLERVLIDEPSLGSLGYLNDYFARIEERSYLIDRSQELRRADELIGAVLASGGGIEILRRPPLELCDNSFDGTGSAVRGVSQLFCVLTLIRAEEFRASERLTVLARTIGAETVTIGGTGIIAITVTLGLLYWFVIRRRNHQLFAEIERSNSIDSYCQIALKSDVGSRVHRQLLRSIASTEKVRPIDIEWLEYCVARLQNGPMNDRLLALQLADVARALSLRLIETKSRI